jgi:hypothetical protein
MFIMIDHQIRNPLRFQERVEASPPIPGGLHLHMFLPADDMSRATCLYEAVSLDSVRDFVDGVLGDAAVNSYVPIAAEQAMGLPAQRVG